MGGGEGNNSRSQAGWQQYRPFQLGSSCFSSFCTSVYFKLVSYHLKWRILYFYFLINRVIFQDIEHFFEFQNFLPLELQSVTFSTSRVQSIGTKLHAIIRLNCEWRQFKSARILTKKSNDMPCEIREAFFNDQLSDLTRTVDHAETSATRSGLPFNTARTGGENLKNEKRLVWMRGLMYFHNQIKAVHFSVVKGAACRTGLGVCGLLASGVYWRLLSLKWPAFAGCAWSAKQTQIIPTDSRNAKGRRFRMRSNYTQRPSYVCAPQI